MGRNNNGRDRSERMEATSHSPLEPINAPEHALHLMLAVLPSSDALAHGPTARTEGFVLHHGDPHELLAVIHALAAGGGPCPERIARKVTVQLLPDEGPLIQDFALSPRETDVLRGMVAGASYKMVADRLGISFETVRTHVKRIYEKLGVRNGTEAVAKALKSGLPY